MVGLSSEGKTLPLAAALPAIGAIAGAGASIYSATSANKANKRALQAQEAAADKALAVQDRAAQQALDFQKQQYADLAPWRSYGMGALQQLAQVNGITLPPQVMAQAQPQAQPTPQAAPLGGAAAQASAASQYLNDNPDVAAEYSRLSKNNLRNNYGINTPEEFAAWHYENHGQAEGRQFGVAPVAAPLPTPASPTPTPAAPTTPANPTAEAADPRFAGFFESPDYAYRVQEGTSAISQNAASRGLLDSGATGKALIDYGQKTGSAEFSNWYNRLAAAAGVGQAATVQSGSALDAQGRIVTDQANNRASSYTDAANNQALGYQSRAGNNAGLVGDLVGIGTGLFQNYGGGGSSNAGRYVPVNNGTVSTPGPLMGQSPSAFNDPTLRTLFGSVL